MPDFTTTNIVLAASALIALAIGARGLLKPAALGSRLGYGIPGPDALNEVRAQYGGFFLAVGIVSIIALLGAMPAQAALIMLAVTFGGVLAGRLVSAALDGGVGRYSPFIRSLYIVDAVGLGASLLALRYS